jgi:AcrR family transcriptional regulator
MDAVAAEAGVGKQTIYRHFRSKEALVEALVEAMCAPEVVRPPTRSLPAGQRLRELLLIFVTGVASPDSVRLYRAIVAEADRMPGLGRLFWEAGPRQVRAAIAQLWAEEHDTATAPTVAEQLVQLALGDASWGLGRPSPKSSSVRSMRRWRSWKWRLAGVGDEKGRSGPVVRICEQERRAADVRNGGRNRWPAICLGANAGSPVTPG